jgi:hypothetical protein
MYDYIFYTLYKYNLKDGKGYAKLNGIIIVGVAIFLHLALIMVVLKKIFPASLQGIQSSFQTNYKSWSLLILFVSILILYFYYNKKRVEKILSKRKPIDINSPNGLDILWVGSLIFIPIALILIFSWKERN